MEHLVSFLDLRDRKSFAQVCKYFAELHRQVPIECLTLTKGTKAYRHRAKKVIVYELFDDLVLPSCRDLSIWECPGQHEVQVVGPRITRFAFTGSWTLFCSVIKTLKHLDFLDIHITEAPDRFSFIPTRIDCLKTYDCVLWPFQNVGSYELSTDLYEQHKERLPLQSHIKLSGGFAKVTSILHSRISLVACSVESLKFLVSPLDLTIQNCNLICSDLPVLFSKRLDFMDNDTLQHFPDVQSKVTRLNLLHTGLRSQVQIALSVLDTEADYVGLSILQSDFHLLPALLTRTIRVVELCCPCDVPNYVTTNPRVLLHSTPFRKRYGPKCNYFVWKRGC